MVIHAVLIVNFAKRKDKNLIKNIHITWQLFGTFSAEKVPPPFSMNHQSLLNQRVLQAWIYKLNTA